MNIDGSHVSIDGLRINSDISHILDKYEIKTYSDLNKEIQAGNQEIANNYFLRLAARDFQRIFLKQESEEEAKAKLELIESKSDDIISINEIDKMVKMYELPYFRVNPRVFYHLFYGYYSYKSKVNEVNFSEFDQYTIANLKKMVNNIEIINGQPVSDLFRCDGIGEFKYNKIIASLNFYDRYIPILLEKYADKENPFYFMHDEKFQLVKENEKYIFDYLLQNGYELFLGSIATISKKVDTLRKRNSVEAKRLENIEEIITNFVTFDEAMDITSPKVLNRFIVPYGKK